MNNNKVIWFLLTIFIICFAGCGGGGGGGTDNGGSSVGPTQVTVGNPANEATNVSINQQLTWAPATGAISYDIYFGITPTPQFIVNTNNTSYNPGILSYSTTYCWRIDSRNIAGTTTGDTWSFTTQPPLPSQVTSPSPTNSATNVIITTSLSWAAANYATSYDVYFGITPTPLLVTNTAATGYTPASLSYSTLYYWRINSKNDGETTIGNIWRFTTKVAPITGFTFTGYNAQGYNEYQHIQTGMIFVEIPAGTFQMGSNTGYSEERPVHSVTLSSFLISRDETTQAVWQAVMGSNPSYFWNLSAKNPVEQVSWNDCQIFCTNTGLRLPTEAEWEYACRAGTTTDYYWGNSIDGNYLWYYGNTVSTQPVEQKLPNKFGLFDMSGNVWEWCSDWYDFYSSSSQTNPTGPATGTYRVKRGGSWQGDTGRAWCRSASRFCGNPGDRYTGFRCVRSK